MEFIDGIGKTQKLSINSLTKIEITDGTVKIDGMIHSIRHMGNIAFIILRRREGLLQTVWEEGRSNIKIQDLKEGCAVCADGWIRKEERAPYGIELLLNTIKILSAPAIPMPLPVDKWRLTASLETRLDMRSLSLRNIRERAKFKIQEGIAKSFRNFLYDQGFTEIHTPKIGEKGAEGGSNMFKLTYFHKPAVLAQSPQFYKQMMVGVFDRVFETGPVFRAEKHNTKRHLNEYTSLDLEMGYIDSFLDICRMETGFLQYMAELLKKEYEYELSILNIQLPNTEKIPYVRFDQAKKLVSEKYDRAVRSPFDLEPEEEQLIGQYFKEEWGADFVFITHYPSKKRPFYTMDDPEDKRYTLSFDLLMGGMEITTGGQRIHDYEMLKEKIQERNMSEEGMEQYLSAFRYGLPPHGGLGIGLERLTMKLLGEENVRETSLFPRDLSRLTP